jgi:hypothetical protein
MQSMKGRFRLTQTPSQTKSAADPFNSTAVPLTTELAELLSMWKDFSASTVSETTKWLFDLSIRDPQQALEDELLARSFIYSLTSIRYSRFDHRQDLQVKCLKAKLRSLEQFQSRLKAVKDGAAKLVLVRALACVFIASVLSKEWQEAEMHAQQLFFWIQEVDADEAWSTPTMACIILSNILYYDAICGLASLRPLILDIQTVLRRPVWAERLTKIPQWLAMHPPSTDGGIVNFPAFSSTAADLFKRLQENIVHLQCTVIPALSADSPSSNAEYSPSLVAVFTLASKLLNHHETLKEDLHPDHTHLNTPEHRRTYNEHIATLAATAFLATSLFGPDIHNMHRRGEAAFSSLRLTLGRSPCVDIPPESDPLYDTYRETHLWALYLGATWEWDTGLFLSGQQSWYLSKLKEVVQTMDIASWHELKEIVDGFVCLPSEEWRETSWFPGMRWPPTPKTDPAAALRLGSAEFLRAKVFDEFPVREGEEE